VNSGQKKCRYVPCSMSIWCRNFVTRDNSGNARGFVVLLEGVLLRLVCKVLECILGLLKLALRLKLLQEPSMLVFQFGIPPLYTHYWRGAAGLRRKSGFRSHFNLESIENNYVRTTMRFVFVSSTIVSFNTSKPNQSTLPVCSSKLPLQPSKI